MLGFPVIAFDANYAMFTSPTGEFTFAVVQTPEGGYSTPSDAIRIQFMVEDIYKTTEELVRRGIAFIQAPTPLSEGSTMHAATFLTPHGIYIDIWGEVRIAVAEVEETDETVEAVESPADEGDIDELPEKPAMKEPIDDEDDFDDLFEEVHDEPVEKAKRTKQNKPKLTSSEDDAAEDGSHEEIQYIDEPEPNFPAYTPIPVRR